MNTKPPFGTPPKRLCMLRLSAIGDVCNTLPVLRTLQAAWPQTEISWIIGKLEHSLLSDIDGIEFIVFDKRQGRQAFSSLKTQLAGRQFDVLLHMQASLRSSRISRLVNAEVKLGFDKERAKDYQWLFTNQRIAPNPRQHMIEGLFGFTEALGITERSYRWDIPLSQADCDFATARVGNDKVLIISPCSSQRSRNFRNWSPKNYAAVVDYAAEKHGIKTLLTGGPTTLEKQYGEEIESLAKAPVVNLIGQTSLKQLLALIDQASAVLAPDSGPIHMAAAVNTPAIGLFAGSNPLRTGPALNQQWLINEYPRAVQREFGKSVDDIAWGKRVRDPEVMSLIKLDSVLEKIDQLAAANDL